VSSTFSAFINNTARIAGGAVALLNARSIGGTFIATKSLFAFNTAAGRFSTGFETGLGGAIYLNKGGGASLLQACTFSRNTALVTGNNIALIGAGMTSVASSFAPVANVDYLYPCSSDVSLGFGDQFKSSFVAPGQLLPICPLLNVVKFDVAGSSCVRTLGDDQYTCQPLGEALPPPRYWWTTA